ncbi:MAG TPA: UDP-N-acetylmuramoyl-L-alanyl-D-glutamate--2,6-diaminopimelate ligase [Acidimicrobiales bacterium]|nr:UDP-N-acetylmuramoyl-L-alanyl-D-glutamate--2,6-diaminopimelate ligase [Acidimicrobiales bacterium]
MRLDLVPALAGAVEVRGSTRGVEVSSIAYDSRRVSPGALFFCVPGTRADGHDFAGQAVAAGAVAVVCERLVDVGVPQLRVPPGRVRPAMAEVSAAFFGHPARAMATVGVTGTNGKTTVTHMLGSILEAHGWPTGVVGTLAGGLTTPEAPDLQGLLARLAGEGHRAVALEVSSHALVQHRVDGMVFDVAVFTNLSQDHLDFHGSMDAYFEAKASLFTPARSRLGVVNADDPFGQRLLERPGVELHPFSLEEAGPVVVDASGSRFRWGGREVRLAVPGRFMVANALAAAKAAQLLGVPDRAVAEGLACLGPPPGRMERVDAGQPFLVLVDYAHTPAALASALSVARELARGRVLVVFGAGGDRDQAKRPEMGRVASELADLAVLTSDNPRSEDPLAIMGQVRAGASGPAELAWEPDRRQAIALALAAARPGDVVLVAGKGHETVQQVGSQARPFDDRQVAREVLESLAGSPK